VAQARTRRPGPAEPLIFGTLGTGDSKLVIVSANQRIQEQLRVTGVADLVGPEGIYTGDERVGATLKRAYADAAAWIERNQPAGEADTARPGRHDRENNS